MTSDTVDGEVEPGFGVVVNDEEQYSIWRLDLPEPPGWHSVGVEGSREVCLAHITMVWTDMRPASLRRAMAQECPDPQAE